jgi:hypothetical protein
MASDNLSPKSTAFDLQQACFQEGMVLSPTVLDSSDVGFWMLDRTHRYPSLRLSGRFAIEISNIQHQPGPYGPARSSKVRFTHL